MLANKNSGENELGRNKGKEDVSDNHGCSFPIADADKAIEDLDSGKRKRYHRPLQHQIQQMEMFYKECPHPDDKQRKPWAMSSGSTLCKSSFWFQNKRTQVKAQQERHDNALLKGENEKLCADNARLQGGTESCYMPYLWRAPVGEMSFDEQRLRIENTRLREEIQRMLGMTAQNDGKAL
ncbi:Homeobox-like domain superfamily [Sesbania bispinosa]|nr:Homeobox-like domain superfamily [Sesbania bispinosa]